MGFLLPGLSGSISAAIGTARAATQLAGTVAQGVTQHAGDVLEFDKVLRGESDTSEPDAKAQLLDATRQTLASLGISPDQSITLEVEPQGRIKVASGAAEVTSRAAEIEAALNNSDLSRLSQQWMSIAGATESRFVELP